MAESDEKKKESGPARKCHWLWPAGVVATSFAGAAMLLLRGCWHRKMSWPVTIRGCAYQVCLGCGVKRLFDEKSFRSYGPFSYDLDKLISWDRSRRPVPSEPRAQRPAS